MSGLYRVEHRQIADLALNKKVKTKPPLWLYGTNSDVGFLFPYAS
jgi:hypothetical protein